MRPYDTDTEDKVCAQKTDNTAAGNFFMLADGRSVTIGTSTDGVGENCSIPRKEFNQLIDWYMADQARK